MCEDGLPLQPYAVNIGGGTPENLLDFILMLQEETVLAGVLPEDYDFVSIANWWACSRAMCR